MLDDFHSLPVLVTGGTGFIGCHVVRRLVDRGAAVRCLVRKESRTDNLRDLPVTLVTGDLRDPRSLAEAAAGCRQAYHVAADYRLWAPDPQDLYRSNVEGTRALLQACADAGVERVVYTSSVGTLGCPGDGTPGTEETPVTLAEMVGHYKRSKFLAEQEALEYAERGLPVVVVNPSTPVGPRDIKPTPTGEIILRFLRRQMPAYVETGLNLVDVEDVAEGHLLAAARGRVGQKYILGNRDMTLKEILEILAGITGMPAPRVRIPYSVALAAAYGDRLVNEWILRRAPGIPLEGVRMSHKKMFFDASKAVRELGLPQSPVEDALRRAVEWFRENGYA